MSDDAKGVSWEIEGADGTDLGNAHEPDSDDTPARGVILMTHGFLGYKDYGMFPYLARLAQAGFITHRYNLSHSGMTNDFETFARPDLFEHDTWNRQVGDVDRIMQAVANGRLAGAGLPLVLWGHSRGGVTSILAAGRRFRDQAEPLPAGVMTASAPDTACRMDEQAKADVLERGYGEVVSNRTGQTLRISSQWLQEQIDDPEAHNVLAHAASIRCPLLVIHGGDDPTVPASCAEQIVQAAQNGGGEARSLLIEGGNHVFNVVNPMPADSQPSSELDALADACVEFAAHCCNRR